MLMSNPMMVAACGQLQENGDEHGRQTMASAAREAAEQRGFLKGDDGGLLFPTNVAIIATAIA